MVHSLLSSLLSLLSEHSAKLSGLETSKKIQHSKKAKNMRSTFQRSTFQTFQSFPNCFQSCPNQLWGPTVLHLVSFPAGLAHKMSDLGMCATDSKKIQEVLRNMVGVRWVSQRFL